MDRILKNRFDLCAALLIISALCMGCGQKGPLYLPTDTAAANRATLPASLVPTIPLVAPSTLQGTGTQP